MRLNWHRKWVWKWHGVGWTTDRDKKLCHLAWNHCFLLNIIYMYFILLKNVHARVTFSLLLYVSRFYLVLLFLFLNVKRRNLQMPLQNMISDTSRGRTIFFSLENIIIHNQSTSRTCTRNCACWKKKYTKNSSYKYVKSSISRNIAGRYSHSAISFSST